MHGRERTATMQRVRERRERPVRSGSRPEPASSVHIPVACSSPSANSVLVVARLIDITVERDESGVQVVRWSADGDAEVDVAIGPTPNPSTHQVVATGTTASEVRLERPGPGRSYVSVTVAGAKPIVVAERRVPFAGITNLRDLGGYRGAGGRAVRWAQVFRADALHKLTDADLERFGELGIRTIFDLRSDVERTDFPNPFESTHVSIVGHDQQVIRSTSITPTSEVDGEQLLHDLYTGSLVHSASDIGGILTAIADDEHRPVLFHCHAGKDRTGVVAAVLLLALGVDRETVLDDYQATSRYRLREHQEDSVERMLANGMAPEVVAGMLGTPRWTMAAAIDAIDAEHGGIDALLTGPGGMTAASLAALRDSLLEPVPQF